MYVSCNFFTKLAAARPLVMGTLLGVYDGVWQGEFWKQPLWSPFHTHIIKHNHTHRKYHLQCSGLECYQSWPEELLGRFHNSSLPSTDEV
jgi:hypothetical protein